MRQPSAKTVVGLAVALVAGGFVLWIQLAFLASLGTLSLGAATFLSSLTGTVDQITGGEYQGAEADFTKVETAASRVTASAQGPHMSVLSAIPGVKVAIDNWQRLGSATADIASSTGELLSLFGDLSGENGSRKIFNDGAIDVARLRDLPPRVAAIDAGVKSSAEALAAIQTTGPMAGALATVQAKALKQVAPVQEAINVLVDLAPQLPDALGANGVRRYLIAIGNQAEMRASGGAPLSLVLVEFDKGRISIPIKGQTSTQLFPPLNAKVKWWGPAMNPFFPANPRKAPMVVTNTHPSLTFAGREMAGAWVGGDFPEVDGVMTLDLTAIAAVLDSLGPIQSAAYGEVTGDQLGKILLIDAYQQFGQAEAEARQVANQQLLDDLLTRLLSGDDLVTAAKAVAGTAPGRHFQVWLRDPDFESVILKSGAGGQVVDPGTGDWSAVYTQNGNQSKVDVFQQRNVLVSVQLAEDGSARVTQQMNLVNATPAERPEGPPERIGYETSWLKNAYIMYVPDKATNYVPAYPQGFAIRSFKNHQQYGRGFANDGNGQKIVRMVGWTPPGGQTTVSVSYDLPAGTFGGDGRPLVYSLRAEPQSLFINSTITVRVTGPDGWEPESGAGMKVSGRTGEVSAVQDAPVNVTMGFRRS
ncbi:MAG: DUF4012 domain-containing protein [Candidatus Nanopelagicales bacterium]